MFNALIKRAQRTMDAVIGQAFNRVLVGVPLLVAAGFATAALTRRLTDMWGDELAYLAVAGLYAVLGLIVAAVVWTPAEPSAAEAASDDSEDSAGDTETSGAQSDAMSDVDRELMTSALSAVGPTALPPLIRLILRNWPLVIAVVGLIFIFAREQMEPNGTAKQQSPSA